MEGTLDRVGAGPLHHGIGGTGPIGARRAWRAPGPRPQPRPVPTLLADNLHQDALGPATVELTVEDLFPWSEVEGASRNRHHDLAAHDLALEVRVGVVLPCVVMPVLGRRRVGGETLQPPAEVLVQSRLVVVDENRGRD